MLDILIADDHPVVRRGLKQILTESPDAPVVDEASNGQEALNKVREGKYDLVLLDISMPGMNGLDVLKELRRNQPELPILILSIHPESQYAIRALKAGASGYLTKDTAPDELILAVQKVLSGSRYISPSVAGLLAENLATDIGRPLHEILSDREYQVLRLIASGKAAKDIAQTLSLSVKTINTYRSRLTHKMRIKTTSELIRYAMENHLLD